MIAKNERTMTERERREAEKQRVEDATYNYKQLLERLKKAGFRSDVMIERTPAKVEFVGVGASTKRKVTHAKEEERWRAIEPRSDEHAKTVGGKHWYQVPANVRVLAIGKDPEVVTGRAIFLFGAKE